MKSEYQPVLGEVVKITWSSRLCYGWSADNYVAPDSPVWVENPEVAGLIDITGKIGTLIETPRFSADSDCMVELSCGSRFSISSRWLKPLPPLQQLAYEGE